MTKEHLSELESRIKRNPEMSIVLPASQVKELLEMAKENERATEIMKLYCDGIHASGRENPSCKKAWLEMLEWLNRSPKPEALAEGSKESEE